MFVCIHIYICRYVFILYMHAYMHAYINRYINSCSVSEISLSVDSGFNKEPSPSYHNQLSSSFVAVHISIMAACMKIRIFFVPDCFESLCTSEGGDLREAIGGSIL